ncbi:MAG TPA: helix-turn-helix domain-containing protein [Blastocatellia bacterium]|nr:helix-turn-helix domain-containing protein [Blastocatellia bacterium]
MPRPRIVLKDHLSEAELKNRYRLCKDPKEARRWHALWLISQGFTTQEAGRLTGLQPSWVRRIASSYNEKGPESIIDGHRNNPGGAKSRLNIEQLEELRETLKQPPPDGGIWTGPKVAAWIEERTNKKTYAQLGWVYLKNLGTGFRQRRHSRNNRVKLNRHKRQPASNDTNL